MKRRHIWVALAVIPAVASLWSVWDRPATIEVRSTDDLQAMLDAAPEGSVLLLQPGRHVGGVRIDRSVTLKGLPGTSIVAANDVPAVVSVAADGTVIEDVRLHGGSSGVIVRESEGVILRDITVTDADLHGIEVVDAAADISDVAVSRLVHPMAQGIEVRNSDGRPDTVVAGSTVDGGQEGLVSHVSEVVFRDNRITSTTMRAIAVTEMSDGLVEDNTVQDVTGAGLYCGDMSRCDFSGNAVTEVEPGSGGLSTDGWGLVVTFHAVASTSDDRLSGEAGSTLTSIGGHLNDDSPLDPSPGPEAWLPVLAATGIALLLSWLLYGSSAPLVRRFQRFCRTAHPPSVSVLPLVLAGLAVQTFHMAEHALQVFRVRIDQIPSRGGIVGPGVEAEWIHFLYNMVVFAAIFFVVIARAKGWEPRGQREVGDRLLVVGFLVQGYHAVEHSLKLVQHLVGGAKVNPGLAGEFVDLVLLHYSINLIVYLAVVGAALAYGGPLIASAMSALGGAGTRWSSAASVRRAG